MSRTRVRFLRPRSRSQSGQRLKSCLSNNPKTTEANLSKLHRLVVLGFTALETVFQSISGRLPKSGRKRRERIDESKNVQTTPPAATASAVGLCPTVIQTVGRPGTGSIPSTIAPPDHPPKLHRKIEHNEKVCRAKS